MPDMPPISTDLDAPLPDVPPDSAMVPFRTSATNPDGSSKTVVGYGPRGSRTPIRPPDAGGVGDIQPGITQAFQNLPVDEALKAVEAAVRYQGLRGYQRDLAGGANAAQAFAKWGPMLFRQATGIPEAIDRSVPTPITPQQLIQNRLNQQKFEASQAAVKAKADAAKVMTPYQAAEVELRKRALDKPQRPPTVKQASITVPLDPSNPDGAKITGPPDDPAVQEAVKKHEEASKPKPVEQKPGLLEKAKDFLTGKPASKVNEVIRVTKDGKKAVFDADTKKFIRYADGQ